MGFTYHHRKHCEDWTTKLRSISPTPHTNTCCLFPSLHLHCPLRPGLEPIIYSPTQSARIKLYQYLIVQLLPNWCRLLDESVKGDREFSSWRVFHSQARTQANKFTADKQAANDRHRREPAWCVDLENNGLGEEGICVWLCLYDHKQSAIYVWEMLPPQQSYSSTCIGDLIL